MAKPRRSRSELSARRDLEAVIEKAIAGEIDILDWWRELAPAPGASFKTHGYRVSLGYLEWITRVARANRTNLTTLIDQAVAKYAREIGVTDPPRIGRHDMPVPS